MMTTKHLYCWKQQQQQQQPQQLRKRRRYDRNSILYFYCFVLLVLIVFFLLLMSSLRYFFYRKTTIGTRTTTSAHNSFLFDSDEVSTDSNNGMLLSPTSESKQHSSINETAVFCLTNECIQQLASQLVRPYTIRTNKSSWCRSVDATAITTATTNNNKKEQGIILVKVTKAASSTSAGVVLRIGQRQSCSNVEWKHRMAHTISYEPNITFLLTTIREPAQRAISTLFFHIFSRQSDKNKRFDPNQISDEVIIQQLQTVSHDHYGSVSNGQGGFQLRYIYPKHKVSDSIFWDIQQPFQIQNPKQLIAAIQTIVESYDFIIMPERMDESLVVLALLLQIDVSDVLVTSSKVTGSQYHLLHPNHRTYQCILPIKSYTSPKVQQYLESDIWRAMNYGDYLLYEMINQSLDRTIHEVIGIERYTVALNRYRTLQSLERTYCAPHVQFPCSNDGVPQLSIAKDNCYLYYYDFGCGYKCIDRMIQQYDNDNLTT